MRVINTWSEFRNHMDNYGMCGPGPYRSRDLLKFSEVQVMDSSFRLVLNDINIEPIGETRKKYLCHLVFPDRLRFIMPISIVVWHHETDIAQWSSCSQAEFDFTSCVATLDHLLGSYSNEPVPKEGHLSILNSTLKKFEMNLVKLMFHPRRDEFMIDWIVKYGLLSVSTVHEVS